MKNSQHQLIIKNNIEILEYFPQTKICQHQSMTNEDEVCTLHQYVSVQENHINISRKWWEHFAHEK